MQRKKHFPQAEVVATNDKGGDELCDPIPF